MGKDWSDCQPGFYSVKGTNPLTRMDGFYCEVCPMGSWCPGGEDVDPVGCPPGWQGAMAGATSEATGCRSCPSGTSCPRGTGIATPCKPGTYSPGGEGECTICSEGWYCPGNTDTPLQCPRGYVAYGTGNSHCTPCSAGHKCRWEEGTTLLDMEICPEGMYQDMLAQTECKVCPYTHYCPEGSITGLYCPKGYWMDPQNDELSGGTKPCV